MKIFILVLFLFSFEAQSRIQPEEGLWDDPNNQGRGVTIEFQNGILVATYFGYDQNGNAQWWQGVGFEGPEGTWSGDFNAFRDGQCNNCNYQFPTLDENNSIGSFTIEFIQSNVANLTWEGGAQTIFKNRYGHGTPLQFILGGWSLTGFSANEQGDYGIAINSVVLRMDEIAEIEGEQIAIGNYSGFGGTTFQAIAAYIGEYNFDLGSITPGGSLISIVYQVDLNGNNFARYDLLINENKAEGTMVLFDSNNIPPPPPGELSQGFLRAAGVRYIDDYERNLLFSNTTNAKDKNMTLINKMLQFLPPRNSK